MTKALQGINLGGWLVLEKWITPSIFARTSANDEWSLGHSLDQSSMRKLLSKHRNNFITKDDVKWIVHQGFALMRLPLGYWVFEDCDGFYGAIEYVDRLFEWAAEYDLGVIIDLHAAPGSQNGWDHSGKAGYLGWHTQDKNIINTLEVLRQLGHRYGLHSSLYGIEVLNEPHWDVPIDILLDFYSKAYETLREVCSKEVNIIVSDSFRPKEVAKGLRANGMTDIVLDSHLYQVFSDEDKKLDFNGHIKKLDTWRNEIRQLTKLFPIIVGEWSSALDQSTFVGVSEKQRNIMTTEYFIKQREMYNQELLAWCYWTYKTEDKGEWSYKNRSFFVLK